jgi:hypothetical protein
MAVGAMRSTQICQVVLESPLTRARRWSAGHASPTLPRVASSPREANGPPNQRHSARTFETWGVSGAIRAVSTLFQLTTQFPHRWSGGELSCARDCGRP